VNVSEDVGVRAGCGCDDVIVVAVEDTLLGTKLDVPIAVWSEVGEHNEQYTGRNPVDQQRCRLVKMTLEAKDIPPRMRTRCPR